MEHLMQDIRYGIRMMLRNRSFTLIAALTLALGIGANTAFVSVVYGVLLRSLPYPDANRVAMVYVHFLPQGVDHGTMSLADYLDWQAQNHAFEHVEIFSHSGGWRFDITGSGEPEQVMGSFVSAGFFSVLPTAPLLGRVFQADEGTPSAPRLTVLSEPLWRRHFGGAASILGQNIDLNGVQYSVVGVMPASFKVPADAEIWLNLRVVPPSRRGPFPYIGLGRLKPGFTFEQAQTETNAIGRRIEEGNPTRYSRMTMPVIPLREDLVGNVRPALLVMLGGVFFVLLIAVVNVANMLLARATSRQKEMATRIALGATRGRIAVQMLTESSLLALLGGVGGWALAYAGIRMLRAWNPGNLPRIEDVRLDINVFAFTALTCLVAGIVFGLVPALRCSRTDLNSSLKEGGRSSTGGPRERTQAIMVVSEIALSVILLAGAGLLLRSFDLLERQQTGVQAPAENVLTMQISPGYAKYIAGDPKGIAFYQRLLARVRQIPGIEAASISSGLPPDHRGDWDTFQIEGRNWSEDSYPSATNPFVSSDYFRSLGIPLLKGRYFTDADTENSSPVCVISASLARRYFEHEDPIGRRLKEGGPDISPTDSPYMEIVGVVGDVRYTGLNAEHEAVYYQPFTQDFPTATLYLVVRSKIPAAGLATTVRREIDALDSNVVVNQIGTLAQVTAESVVQPRFRTALLGIFAVIAQLLAAVGIYGVIAYSVSQRKSEIGVRMALGAQREYILRAVMARVLRWVSVGLILGAAASFGFSHAVAGLLFGVKPTDPLTFLVVVLLTSFVALAACYVPARRAMNVDPIVALRSE